MKLDHKGVDGADIAGVKRDIARDIADNYRIQLSKGAESRGPALSYHVRGQSVQRGNDRVAVDVTQVRIDVQPATAHSPRDGALVDHDIAELEEFLGLVKAQRRAPGPEGTTAMMSPRTKGFVGVAETGLGSV